MSLNNEEYEQVAEKYRDRLEQAKVKAKQAAERLGRLATDNSITHDALAKETGYQRSNITRLFGGRYTPRLDIIIRVLTAVSTLTGQSFTLKDIDYTEPENGPETEVG